MPAVLELWEQARSPAAVTPDTEEAVRSLIEPEERAPACRARPSVVGSLVVARDCLTQRARKNGELDVPGHFLLGITVRSNGVVASVRLNRVVDDCGVGEVALNAVTL